MYCVRIRVDGGAAGEEEVRIGGGGDSRLDATDGLRDRAELEGADAGGGEERGEDHVVPWGDADDVVEAGIDALHQPASRPTGPQHH